MNTTKLVLSVVCVALLNPSIISSEDIDKNLHNKCLYPTVYVSDVVINSDNTQTKELGSGSGVIIKSKKVGGKWHNLVLTCNHVVDVEDIKTSLEQQFGTSPKFGIIIKVAKYQDWSRFVKYDEYPAFVYSQFEEGDMALLLFVSNEKMPVAELNINQKLYIGNEITKVGCGMGDQPRVEFGKITSINPTCEEFYKGCIRMSAHTVYGDSGGPVFYKDKVIGLASSIRVMGGGPFSTPIFQMGFFQPMLTRMPAWNKTENNDIGFIYNEEKIPVIPFIKLKLEKLIPDKNLLPKNKWHDKLSNQKDQLFEMVSRRMR